MNLQMSNDWRFNYYWYLQYDLQAVIVLQLVTIIYITIFYVTSLPTANPPFLPRQSQSARARQR